MASCRQDRFAGIKRDYTPETVRRLSGSLKIEYTLAQRGAEKLWDYMTAGGNEYINVLGALTGKFDFGSIENTITVLTGLFVEQCLLLY